MPAAPAGGGNQSDNSAGILWGVAAVFATVGITWFAFKSQIINFYLNIKLYELDFIAFLSNYLPINTSTFDRIREVISYAKANPAKVGYNDLLMIGASVGDSFRIPFLLIMLALAVLVYFSNTTRVYKRIYSMKELAKLEKGNWPQITPVVGLDLIKTDIDVGPWAMAMTPMQFCKRNKLLQEVRVQRGEGTHRERIDVVLKRGEANKIFALQLGPAWHGTNKLPIHIKALFAVFAARVNADSKAAADLLAKMSATAGKTYDEAVIDALLKKHENTKLVQQVINSHAYVLTVMAAMLQAARDDGVQASADFLWLKPIDRRFWYTLNTVGRQTPFIEVAGIFAHWIAEKEAGRKLLVPMVEEATNALELALKEVVYRPDEKTG